MAGDKVKKFGFAISIQWGFGIHYFITDTRRLYPEYPQAMEAAKRIKDSYKRYAEKGRKGARPIIRVWKMTYESGKLKQKSPIR